MTSEDLSAEFIKYSGNQVLTELILCLNELCSKDPAFATAAAIDSVLAFEALVRKFTDAKEEHIVTACQLFSCAVHNAATDVQSKIIYETED